MAEKLELRHRQRTESTISCKNDKRKCGGKWRLLDFKALPTWMKDNEFICGGYRPQMSSLRDCLVTGFSIFHIHNETVNTLSHFIGFLMFTGITLYTLLYATRSSRFLTATTLSPRRAFETSIHHTTDEFFRHLRHITTSKTLSIHVKTEELFYHLRNFGYKFLSDYPITYEKDSSQLIKKAFERLLREHRFGMIPMLVSCIACMLSSTIYHTFWIYSKTALSILAKIDYICIALLTSGHMLMGIKSGFFCRPKLGFYYQIFIVICSIILVLWLMFQKDFISPHFRLKRTAVFCALGAVAFIPICHLWILHNFSHPEWWKFLWSIGRTIFCYIGAAAVFASRIPERFRPGKHDKYGASHQLMHFAVIGGAFVHWYDTLSHFHYRMENGCTLSPL